MSAWPSTAPALCSSSSYSSSPSSCDRAGGVRGGQACRCAKRARRVPPPCCISRPSVASLQCAPHRCSRGDDESYIALSSACTACAAHADGAASASPCATSASIATACVHDLRNRAASTENSTRYFKQRAAVCCARGQFYGRCAHPRSCSGGSAQFAIARAVQRKQAACVGAAPTAQHAGDQSIGAGRRPPPGRRVHQSEPAKSAPGAPASQAVRRRRRTLQHSAAGRANWRLRHAVGHDRNT